MKYETVNVIGPEIYSRELENLVGNGYHVISAGAAPDARVSCMRWWAIAEKNDEPQQTPETQPADVAELLEAKRKIANMCRNRQGCPGCCFLVEERCALGSLPVDWDD